MNSADFSNCSHKWVGDISNQISRGDNSVKIIETVFVNLRTNVAEQKLYGGDISGIVDASQQLVPLASSQLNGMSEVYQKVEFTRRFTNYLGQSGDQLLSDGASIAWNQLQSKDRIRRASSLMLVLEQSMVLVSENMDAREETLNFTNWASTVTNIVSSPSSAMANDVMFSPNARMFSTANVGSPESGTPRVVEFSGFKNAPTMTLPSFDVLGKQIGFLIFSTVDLLIERVKISVSNI